MVKMSLLTVSPWHWPSGLPDSFWLLGSGAWGPEEGSEQEEAEQKEGQTFDHTGAV